MISLRKITTLLLQVTVLAVALAASGVKNQQSAGFLSKLIAASGALAAGQELRIADINTDSWDSMFVFAPYSTQTEIETAIGAKATDAIIDSAIGERDDINLLIFMNADHVQLVAVVPRGQVDFSIAAGAQPINRDKASFKRLANHNTLAWTGSN